MNKTRTRVTIREPPSLSFNLILKWGLAVEKKPRTKNPKSMRDAQKPTLEYGYS